MSREWRTLVGVAVLAATCACAAPGVATPNAPAIDDAVSPARDVTCLLRAPRTVRLAEPVVSVTFTLRNDGATPVRILARQTPLEGMLGDLFDVSLAGQRLDYRGPIVKRGPPTDAEYVTLASGDDAQATVDLLEGYDLGRAGEYTVRFNGVDRFACNELQIERN